MKSRKKNKRTWNIRLWAEWNEKWCETLQLKFQTQFQLICAAFCLWFKHYCYHQKQSHHLLCYQICHFDLVLKITRAPLEGAYDSMSNSWAFHPMRCCLHQYLSHSYRNLSFHSIMKCHQYPPLILSFAAT